MRSPAGRMAGARPSAVAVGWSLSGAMIKTPPLRPLVATLLASTFLSGTSFAATPSGHAIKVDPTVNANGADGSRVLEIQGAVYMGDQIVSSPIGVAQIRFVDNTRLVIGPNSQLRIDEFIFNANNTAQKVTINAVKGAFRFISGNSPHEAYSIRTPTMEIGVRGTVVDISVRGSDSAVAFTSGSGSVCDSSGCITATDDCSLHVVPNVGGFHTLSRVQTQQRIAASFPFLMDQGNLDLAFRTDTSRCETPDSRLFTPPPADIKHASDRIQYR